jgi:hypothetical protein
MAALARRTWLDLQTETQRRLAGINATGFTTRIQYWLRAAHFDLCTKYHFFELDKEDLTKTLTIGSNLLALPADCYRFIAMTVRDPVSLAQIGEVVDYSFSALRQAYTATSGMPTRRARFAQNLYFNFKADLAYPVDICYYRLPTAPDFGGSASPDTGEDVDEHIIEQACRLANPALGRPDLGDIDRGLLMEWLNEQPRPMQVQEPLEKRDRMEQGRNLGGAQG